MTRRLTFAIVGVVVGALLLAGLGTLLLVQVGARREARADLREQAERVAPLFEEIEVAARRLGRPQARPAVRAPVLEALRRAFALQGADVVVLSGGAELAARLPAGVELSDADVRALEAGEAVSGGRARLVWGAAPADTRAGTVAVVLTREVGTVTAGLGWFVVAATVTILVAVVVATRLGHRLTRPVRDAAGAAHRIAAGDLTARVDDPGSDDELGELARSVNAMAVSLARAKNLERQFLLSVSHDLRTPLTSIRGYAEAVADGAAPDPARAGEVIAAESRRLERLVGDLLDLAKLDSRTFSLRADEVDVGEVVRATTDGFAPAAARLGLELSVRTPEVGPAARADADRVAQIVANLVENALKFAAHRVAVHAEARAEQVLVRVDDDGPGIPPDEVGRVFERLYQSARTPARQVGSGLGLAIVAELAAAMGGRAWAESPAPPGGGTRVVVSLPSWSSSGGGAASSTSSPAG